MAAQKRSLDDSSTNHKSKKSKIANAGEARSTQPATHLIQEEADFPRGGGTSFTPLEVKAIRAEAVKEANEELFEVGIYSNITGVRANSMHVQDTQAKVKTPTKRKRKSEAQTATVVAGGKSDKTRIEHLNYKASQLRHPFARGLTLAQRINIGMKILGQVVSIQPLALIVSLPNQLFAHVPITNISSQLTALLEKMEEDEEEPSSEEDDDVRGPKSRVPDLAEIFREGQYVRGVATAVHAQGSNDASGIGKSRDQAARSSRRVELSLVPERVNAGVQKTDLITGFVSTYGLTLADVCSYPRKCLDVDRGRQKYRRSWIYPRAWCTRGQWIFILQRRGTRTIRSQIQTSHWTVTRRHCD